jgi:hypothetical protein
MPETISTDPDASVVDSLVINLPSEFAIAGDNVGDVVLDVTLVPQTEHTVLAGPTSGSPAVPTFRALEVSDMTALGLGTAAVENLEADIIDNGSGSLTMSSFSDVAGTYTVISSITINAEGRVTAISGT